MHAVGTQMKLQQLQLKGKKILQFLRSNIVLNMTNEIHIGSLMHFNHYGRIFLRISSMDNLIRHESLIHLYLSLTCTNPVVPSKTSIHSFTGGGGGYRVKYSSEPSSTSIYWACEQRWLSQDSACSNEMLNKNSNIQGRSPDVVKVIFSYFKELLIKERIRSLCEQILSFKTSSHFEKGRN